MSSSSGGGGGGGNVFDSDEMKRELGQITDAANSLSGLVKQFAAFLDTGGTTGGGTGGGGGSGGGDSGGGTSGAVDAFGVKKIYPDDPAKASQLWLMPDKGLDKDPRIKWNGTATEVGNGIWQGTPTLSNNPASFRINVKTTTPNCDNQSIQMTATNNGSYATMASNGFVVDKNDFKNFEGTIYYKIVKSMDSDEMTIYGRGGRHTDGWPAACLSTAYKCQIRTNGTTRFAKEYHHFASSDGYVFKGGNAKPTGLSSTVGRLIGQKGIVYTKPDGVIRCEVWIDTDAGVSGTLDLTKQNWRLVGWIDDDGNWGQPKNTDYMTQCKATAQQKFTWGGPTVTFRLDNNIVQFQKVSVREIIPPTTPPSS